MSLTYAEELRDEAARAKPYDMRKAKIAGLLEAYDCLGGAEDMREILRRARIASATQKEAE